jgi:hypothetical protein
MTITPPQNALSNTCFKTWMTADNICCTQVKPNAVIELKDAVQNRADVISIAMSKIPPILVDLREIKSISREARDYFSMKNHEPQVSAIAMVVRSPLSKVIGNFFLGVNKPVVPTHLFTSAEKAYHWLLENRQRK